MSAEQRTLAILGTTGAGKTTYIARLWLSVQERIGRLHAVGLPQTFKPLKDLSEYLLKGEYPAHTQRGEPTSFHVPLQWSGRRSTVPFALSFTDYSGEELEQIFKYRDGGWSNAWKLRSTESLGLLLFLKPTKIILPMSTRLAEPPEDLDSEGFRYMRGEPIATNTSPPLTAEDPGFLLGPEFQPEETEEEHRRPHPGEPARPPTAVTLVETLQFLRHERGLIMGETPDPDHFRIAVLVSCWDQIPDEVQKKGPEEFVKVHFPLLNDFLRSNFDMTGVRLFGISSTGGDLNRPVYKDKYYDLDSAKVGEVVYHPVPGGQTRSDPDITLPIGWLLEGESALPNVDAV